MAISAAGKLRQRIVDSALNLLFPPRCVHCHGDFEQRLGEPLVCTTCLEQLFLDAGDVCRRCAMPVPAVSKNANDCARCRNERLPYDRATALGIYSGELRKAVIAMKQSRHESLTWAIGGLLANHLKDLQFGTDATAIVPMPIHWSRRMSRGMNVAELLAERLGRILDVPVIGDALKCQRKTKKQGTLNPSERRTNVRGAFTSSRRVDLDGAEILLVDDVMTTGATVNEAAKVCRRAGAKSIAVAVVARGTGVD
ncbi:MAG: ComF family protein [Planctomycetes bacterium]|nr:ComF family protein [Planctomycetota bacterium]